MRLVKCLLVPLLVLLACPSFAATYFWQGTGTAQLASASLACDALHTAGGYPAQGQGSVFDHLTMISAIKAECFRKVPGFGVYSYGFVNRSGDSCPQGSTYDATIGECKPDPSCKDKPPLPFSKSGTAPDPYMTLVTSGGKPMSIPRTEGCFSGCMASTTDQKCTVKVSGAYFCRGTAYFDGQNCDTAGTPGVDSSSTAEYPQTADTNNSKPCNYTTQPDGTQACTSEQNSEKEGQVCGVVSATGEKICTDKAPSKNGLQIATVVKTETLPDGKTQTTKTDTATTTKCSAINTCTTTTTTVKTVTTKGTNGATEGVSSSCSGANCPDKSTNPDGNGDGLGDCVSGDCGDGEGGEGGGVTMPELEDVDGYDVTLQKFYDRASSAPLMAGVRGLSIAGGGSCPSMSVDTQLAGTISTSSFCQLAPQLLTSLRFLFLAVWAWAAVRLFMTA